MFARRSLVFVSVSFLMGVLVATLTFVIVTNAKDGQRKRLPVLVSQDGPQSLASGVGVTTGKRSKDDSTLLDIESDFSFEHLLQLPGEFEQKMLLYQYVGGLKKPQIFDLFERSMEIGEVTKRQSMQSVILERLVSLDAERTLALVQNLGGADQQIYLGAIFGTWAKLDLRAAVEGAVNLPIIKRELAVDGILEARTDLSQSEVEEILRQLGIEETYIYARFGPRRYDQDLDPRIAMRELKERPLRDHNKQFFAVLDTAIVWYEVEGLAAMPEIFDSLGNEPGKFHLMQRLVRRTIVDDPKGILNIVDQLGDKDDQVTLTREIFESWASIDLEAALKTAEELDGLTGTSEHRRYVYHEWATNDPYAVLNQIDHLPRNTARRVKHAAIRTIARESPRSAIQFLEQIEDGMERYEVTSSIAHAWSDLDPKASIEWILSLHEGSNAESFLPFAVLRLAQVDAEAAMDIAAAQKGALRTQLEANVVKTIARTDVADAFRAVEELPDERQLDVGKALGRDVVRYAPDQVIRFGNRLDSASQYSYYNSVLTPWLIFRLDFLIEEIDQLPTKEIASLAAFRVISEQNGRISDAQFDFLFERLDENQQAKINLATRSVEE